MNEAHSRSTIQRCVASGQLCCDPEWEAAYARFETPEEEVAKFIRRLKKLRLAEHSSSIRCAELFCGRGSGLLALEQLGFSNLTGVDLSETLLQQYQGPATLYLADCRSLPLEDNSHDAVIVQGGLHHLPDLDADLETVLEEISRVLHPGGCLYLVEPWLTPFLRLVHVTTSQPLVRKIYRRGDALAEMIERERSTYERWLHSPEPIRRCLERHFKTKYWSTAWGKLKYAGSPRD